MGSTVADIVRAYPEAVFGPGEGNSHLFGLTGDRYSGLRGRLTGGGEPYTPVDGLSLDERVVYLASGSDPSNDCC